MDFKYFTYTLPTEFTYTPPKDSVRWDLEDDGTLQWTANYPKELTPLMDAVFYVMGEVFHDGEGDHRENAVSLLTATNLVVSAYAARDVDEWCVCGCGGSWFDPESDDYLSSHVECDECGEEFPVDESFTERTQEYADGPITTQYYCPECCGDEQDPEQDLNERLFIDLTLGDL